MKTISVLLLLISATGLSQNFTAYEKREFKSKNGIVLLYRILYPRNYEKSKEYPVVLFLHGAGERGNDNEKQLIHGSRLFLSEEAREKYPAIVIFPQCATDSYWSSVNVNRDRSPAVFDFDYSRQPTSSLNGAIELLGNIIKTESVDKHRIYITGLSMGGMGTFEAVYRNPKLFAAALPICGGGDEKKYDRKIKKVKFRVFHGADDVVVGVENSRKMVEKLKALKADVRYTEYAGVNHNSWDNAFAEPDFLSWMFAHRR